MLKLYSVTYGITLIDYTHYLCIQTKKIAIKKTIEAIVGYAYKLLLGNCVPEGIPLPPVPVPPVPVPPVTVPPVSVPPVAVPPVPVPTVTVPPVPVHPSIQL